MRNESPGSNPNSPEAILDAFIASRKPQHTDHDELLRTVHFLYGKTLEAALVILDSCHNDPRTIVRVVSAASQRTMHLVKKSSSYGNASEGTASYCCMVGDRSDDLPFYFCSCRSFLEKSSRPQHSGSSILCKHLLAVRLWPLLGQVVVDETVSDEAFAQQLAQNVVLD